MHPTRSGPSLGPGPWSLLECLCKPRPKRKTHRSSAPERRTKTSSPQHLFIFHQSRIRISNTITHKFSYRSIIGLAGKTSVCRRCDWSLCSGRLRLLQETVARRPHTGRDELLDALHDRYEEFRRARRTPPTMPRRRDRLRQPCARFVGFAVENFDNFRFVFVSSILSHNGVRLRND